MMKSNPKKLTLFASGVRLDPKAVMDFQSMKIDSKHIKPITKISAVNVFWGPNGPWNAVLGLRNGAILGNSLPKPYMHPDQTKVD